MKVLFLLIGFIIMNFQESTTRQAIAVGDQAPQFTAQADDGSTWDLNDHIGKDYIVVYFYPGAMTSGCTKQACAYRDRQEELQSEDVTVVGISGDKVENLKLFKKAENLNFTLLSDTKGEIATAFGVPTGAGSTFKKVVDGNEHEITRDLTSRRWTFIIGKDGKIIYKNDAVNAENDTQEVLNFIKSSTSQG
jgi:peroxiredoxin Q/BCP